MTQPPLPGLAPASPPFRRTITAAVPSWLPPALASLAQASGSAAFSFSRGERQALRRRVLPETARIKGKWHNLFTPYLVGIMDAAGHPGVEVVILCKTPQTGGSEAGHNIIGYAIDRTPSPHAPGNVQAHPPGAVTFPQVLRDVFA